MKEFYFHTQSYSRIIQVNYNHFDMDLDYKVGVQTCLKVLVICERGT
jgi:hypothetical protein